MSNVNIRRLVDNIRSGTNVYTPIVEAVVNAIQAIEARPTEKGRVTILVHRSSQEELDGGLASPESFTIIDNGIGFNQWNRDHFDTLYTDHKLHQGGKGFGRFTWLKYFDDLVVESVFETNEGRMRRSFSMGTRTEIIVGEKVEACADGDIGSRILMRRMKGRAFPDKKLRTIARTLVERLLPYFIDEEYSCPEISVSEEDHTGRIVLNDFVSNQLAAMIEEIPLETRMFSLGEGEKEQAFQVRVFKIFSPRNQKSKISLVADRREVIETTIHTYFPEFVSFSKRDWKMERKETGIISLRPMSSAPILTPMYRWNEENLCFHGPMTCYIPLVKLILRRPQPT